jgi:hypothetical protein
VQNPLPVRLGLHREAACFSSRGLSAGETPSQLCVASPAPRRSPRRISAQRNSTSSPPVKVNY